VKDPRDVIIRPVVSEKSYAAIDQGKYTFEVNPSSPKEEIRWAVEQIFNVGVKQVNTMKMHPKRKRQGHTSGMTRNWKKAIVTLAPGEKIELFEGR
jgi:large subunit ribosomal protein L23